jgi:hypothetical protein
LNDLQFVFTTGLRSSGVVENITFMISEDYFVLDVMQATLQAGLSGSFIAVLTGISLPNLYRGVELSPAGL